MKKHPLAVLLVWTACCPAPAVADVAGTQCWIDGKLEGGFPPGYVCPGTGGGDRGSSPPSYDYEAEHQRQLEAERQRLEDERQRQIEAERQKQRELDEQRKREEEARKKRDEFERNKQEALRSMKGIAEGELGLKGGEAGELGLKGTDSGPAGLGLRESQAAAKPKAKKMECEWGTLGASVVDLRCLGLDPNKPVTVDPHIARGEERAFPAQPDPETFRNANYNKGFAALKRFDAASAAEAVQHFQNAQKERPKDPLVRNGLLLAQDIFKAREQKERNDRAQSSLFTLQAYAAMMMGENGEAKNYIAQARKLAPKDNNARFVESLVQIDLGPEGTHPKRKEAYRLVANGLVSIRHKNLAGAAAMLEAAQRLQPRDQFINMFLEELRKYEGRR